MEVKIEEVQTTSWYFLLDIMKMILISGPLRHGSLVNGWKWVMFKKKWWCFEQNI